MTWKTILLIQSATLILFMHPPIIKQTVVTLIYSACVTSLSFTTLIPFRKPTIVVFSLYYAYWDDCSHSLYTGTCPVTCLIVPVRYLLRVWLYLGSTLVVPVPVPAQSLVVPVPVPALSLVWLWACGWEWWWQSERSGPGPTRSSAGEPAPNTTNTGYYIS